MNLRERVTVSIADGVAAVVLTRGSKHNGLDGAMFSALNEAQDAIAADSSVRAVVITADGPSFCAGLDFAAVEAEGLGPDTMLVPYPGSKANFAQRAAYGWAELDVPVIAALRGSCLGGGMQLALAADIRFAALDTRMSVMEVKWGLIPDMGLTQSLPRLVRADIAKELVWSGRTVGAIEAYEIGLITRLSNDPVADARAAATAIARQSPHAIRAGKKLVRDAWSAPTLDGLELEESLQRDLLGSPNQIVAVTAGMTKTAPVYSDVE